MRSNKSTTFVGELRNEQKASGVVLSQYTAPHSYSCQILTKKIAPTHHGQVLSPIKSKMVYKIRAMFNHFEVNNVLK